MKITIETGTAGDLHPSGDPTVSPLAADVADDGGAAWGMAADPSGDDAGGPPESLLAEITRAEAAGDVGAPGNVVDLDAGPGQG